MELWPQLFQSQLVAPIASKENCSLSIKLFFKYNFELWIFSGPDNTAGVSRLCEWEKEAPDVGPVEHYYKSPDLFFSFHVQVHAISTSPRLLMSVIRTSFALFVNTFISRLYSQFGTFFSFCQNPHLYLTAVSLSSSLVYTTASALPVLAVFTTCPPLPPTPRACLSKQLNWSWNAKCLLVPFLVTEVVYFRTTT